MTTAANTPVLENARWTQYVVKDDGFAYAAGKRAEPYVVSTAVDLAAHLGRIVVSGGQRVEERVPALLEFYRCFGFLRRLNKVYEHLGIREVRMAEEIIWALQHARNVNLILQLQHARYSELDQLLQSLATRGNVRVTGRTRQGVLDRQLVALRCEEQELRPNAGNKEAHRCEQVTKQIERIEREQRDLLLDAEAPRRLHGMSIPITRAPWHKSLSFSLQSALRASDPLSVSRRVIAELLDSNLAAVRRIYDAQTGAPRFVFENLIDGVYWQLANSLDAACLMQCPCGAMFFASDGRQKHCPPLPGQRESRCTARLRMRRRRRGSHDQDS